MQMQHAARHVCRHVQQRRVVEAAVVQEHASREVFVQRAAVAVLEHQPHLKAARELDGRRRRRRRYGVGARGRDQGRAWAGGDRVDGLDVGLAVDLAQA
eukprot:196349-Chlamydomonas_euryale.AAC.1